VHAARLATPADIGELERLYGRLRADMEAQKPIWHLVDGLPEPIGAAFAEALAADDVAVFVGTWDDVPVGFMLVRDLAMLPQAGDARRGLIDLVYVEPEAREVGVGEALLDAALAWLSQRGIRLYDARVLPGLREPKNFFEGAGFSARSILMHHAADPA
jgi:GNAT superfamily N-acetyltransferase